MEGMTMGAYQIDQQYSQRMLFIAIGGAVALVMVTFGKPIVASLITVVMSIILVATSRERLVGPIQVLGWLVILTAVVRLATDPDLIMVERVASWLLWQSDTVLATVLLTLTLVGGLVFALCGFGRSVLWIHNKLDS